MNEEIDRAPLLLHLGEHGIDRRDVFDIARHQEIRTRRFRQRLDALEQRIALIGESEFSAVVRQRLGDTPRNRMIVGDAHDEPALALHQFGHSLTSASWKSTASASATPPSEGDGQDGLARPSSDAHEIDIAGFAAFANTACPARDQNTFETFSGTTTAAPLIRIFIIGIKIEKQSDGQSVPRAIR